MMDPDHDQESGKFANEVGGILPLLGHHRDLLDLEVRTFLLAKIND